MSANERQVGGEHYKTGGEEHWDRQYRLFGPGYFVGCATKYIERYREKNGKQDLEKAIHFIEKLIELEYPEETPLAAIVERIIAHVKPTGYVGWTYEGGTKDWDAFRCIECREHVQVKPGEPPPNHDCGEKPSRAYVDQDVPSGIDSRMEGRTARALKG